MTNAPSSADDRKGELPSQFRFELEISATPAAVWKAMTDASELQRWFPISARVQPGVGGHVFLSWGPACEGEAPITIWEPQRRLGWKELHDGGAIEVMVQWELEPRHGGEATLVRVVQSGFGRGSKWSDYYDSISSGWKFEFRSLRHYLQRHLGQNRACSYTPIPNATPRSRSDAWAALTGPQGPFGPGGLPELIDDRPYAFTGPEGRRLSGTVVRHVPERVLAIVVHEWNDGLLRMELEPQGPEACMPMIWMSVWGGSQPQVDELAQAWSNAMKRALS